MKISRALFCLLIFAALLTGTARGAEKTPPSAPVPTNITSDNLRYDANKGEAVFSGNVNVKRPDFTLTSQKLTVYFLKDGEAKLDNNEQGAFGLGGGKVEKLIAEGDVKAVMEGERQGACDKMTYTMHDGLIVMEGSPRLTEGPNRVKGDKILFYTNENRSEVLGQAEMEFVTDEKQSL